MTSSTIVFFFIISCFGQGFSGILKEEENGVLLNCDIDCTLPPLPQNGRYRIEGHESHQTGSLVQNGTIIEYVCDPGYDAVIDSNAICKDGEWVTDFFKCHKNKKCLLPELPANGAYTLSKAVAVSTPGSEVPNWSRLTYSCGNFHDLVGNNEILCQNGVWSSSPPTCAKNYQCSIPNLIDNANYQIIGSDVSPISGSIVDELTPLYITCKDGYTIIGNAVTVCFKGTWFGKGAICKEKKTCDLPEYPDNGRYLVVGSENGHGVKSSAQEFTVLEFSCNDNYNLEGANIIYCHNNRWSNKPPTCTMYYEECADLPNKKSGEYIIKPSGIVSPFAAYCDMELDNGKWTVIQSRYDGSVDFHRTFDEYTDGFGLPSGEFWIGLERLYQLTKDKKHELYIELVPFNETKKIARFREFSIESKTNGYKLNVTGYSGTAGDSLTRHNGKKFSTYDKEQNDWSTKMCIDKYRSGWWFGKCEYSNLNGKYFSTSKKDWTSMHWETLFSQYSLKGSRMLIRRRP